jgi:hypothetical protein
MKVIFLDNDGVICLAHNWGSRKKKRQKAYGWYDHPSSALMPVEYRFDNFDVKAVKILNQILEQTGAEIVVSSDWRFHASLSELGDYYESKGIIKRPIDTTAKFADVFPREWSSLRFRAELELERSMEIQHWLSQHPEVTHWVAVDDLNMGVEFLGERFVASNGSDEKPGLTNFVWTNRDYEGIKQCGIKDKIIKYLS